MRHQQVRPPPVGTSTFEQEYPLPPSLVQNFADIYNAYPDLTDFYKEMHDHHTAFTENVSNYDRGGPNLEYSSGSAHDSAEASHLQPNPIESTHQTDKIINNLFEVNPNYKINYVTQDLKISALVTSWTLTHKQMSNSCKKLIERISNEILGHERYSLNGMEQMETVQIDIRRRSKKLREIFFSVWTLNSKIAPYFGPDVDPKVHEANDHKLMRRCGTLLLNNGLDSAMDFSRSSKASNPGTLSVFEQLLYKHFSSEVDDTQFHVKADNRVPTTITSEQHNNTRLAMALIEFYYKLANEKKFNALFGARSFTLFLARLSNDPRWARYTKSFRKALGRNPENSLLPWEKELSVSESQNAELLELFRPNKNQPQNLQVWLSKRVEQTFSNHE
ncbi:hypothetical protein O181_097299 [Austropuccinia psidii MF-1]|uniref:Uncharacterized protein n=1 Tax=Austropuccinia psidii MF-1 TaxID=1389203 RepID=A0A9Q3PDH5_9BASI|nr:hypothetical protein [Austropuccinia psidii MF-1]